MNPKVKLILVLALVIASISAMFFNKGEYKKLAENVCEESCEEKLLEAKQVVVYKDPMDFKKEYIVLVNDEVVAKLKGKYAPLFGDVYSVYDPKGEKLILSEEGRKKIPIKAGKIKFDRGGVIMNAKKEEVGYLVEDLFTIGTEFHYFDENKGEIAMLKGKVKLISFVSEFEILDNGKKELYHIKQDYKFRQTIYNVDVKDNSQISIHEALILLAAGDEENDE